MFWKKLPYWAKGVIFGAVYAFLLFFLEGESFSNGFGPAPDWTNYFLLILACGVAGAIIGGFQKKYALTERYWWKGAKVFGCLSFFLLGSLSLEFLLEFCKILDGGLACIVVAMPYVYTHPVDLLHLLPTPLYLIIESLYDFAIGAVLGIILGLLYGKVRKSRS